MLKSRFQEITSRSIDDIVARVAMEYYNSKRPPRTRIGADSAKTKIQFLLSQTSIGYSSINPTEFVLYFMTDPYILRNSSGEHFYFEKGIKIGRNLKLSEDNLFFTGVPKILRDAHYNHPFVFSSNEICYANDDRWRNSGLFWNSAYSLRDSRTYRLIAYWLNEANEVLKRGYFGGVTPVHSLERKQFSAEFLEPAKAYYKGVPIFNAVKS